MSIYFGIDYEFVKEEEMTDDAYVSLYDPGYEDVYPEHLDCSQCGTSLQDWTGNVMVEREAWDGGRHVSSLRVWCKACTSKADNERGIFNVPHAMWELSWIKDEFNTTLNNFLTAQVHGFPTWSREAIEDFRHICNTSQMPGEYVPHR